MVTATDEKIEDFITEDVECIEILKDLINGDYTIEALRQDFEEWLSEGEQMCNICSVIVEQDPELKHDEVESTLHGSYNKPNPQLETFLEEFEMLLTKTYGENWWYSFDVQEGVLLSLSIPYNSEAEGEGGE